MDQSVLETMVLKEEEFLVLKSGGFFRLILDHPDVAVYRTDRTIGVHIPGKGFVQILTDK